MEAKVSTVNSTRGGRSPTSIPEHETAQLRQKILEMTALCQQLKDHVEFLESRMSYTGEDSSRSHEEANGSEASHSSELAMLKEKLKELVAMNVNWQRHNGQQEIQIRELKERIRQLEKELATRSSGQLPESQQIEFDQILLAKKHQCNSLEEEKTRIEEENQRLKQKVATIQAQHDGLAKTLSEVQERSQLLEAQLVMYQEDFKTERSDRERAQSRNADLEMLVADLQRQMPYEQSSRYSPQNSFSNRLSHHAVCQPREELLGRGVNLYQTDGRSDARSSPSSREPHRSGQYGGVLGVFQTDGTDETDGAYQVVIAEDMPNYQSIVASNELSCPKCRRGFLRNQHLELLEHMEECG